ncbi:pyridoxamine 5'-phosphate oxidase family protein [Stackebrandtia nassauensis]|uniref:Pyridoxamine 5'-phosphate oxidase-related FMN-binding protein n=1 Tax=Stackebrandtia nassauensis (strain DSM 44728 / CIP 108903 / NRRL B-16338 / NBRC 102104 / LLR-40K-21) TaxID=446470 RepID=D3Q5V7_STANL|nr:pyridoxamine 5'-phosphate oxidase family protein [Stackebrandtia nassauensis]ADD40256.1 pyridoxamine 5'-phosphate oxidase-related FMN- binding protein [Stackebrandtia nassauensis DSM 44728]
MEPVETAKHVIDSNKYLTLGSVLDDGNPWTTPVYFTPDGYHRFYWVSNPDSVHSRNIAARSRVRIVVFDSSVRIGGAEAVFMDAEATLVPEAELADASALYSGRFPELREFGVDELTAPNSLRLYRADALNHEILVRGSDPVFGKGTDSRLLVDIPRG